MNTNYGILAEILIIDCIFLLLVAKYIKINKLEKLLNKKSYKLSTLNTENKSRNTKFKNKIQKLVMKRLKADRQAFEKEDEFKNHLIFQYIIPFFLFISIIFKFKRDSFPLILVPFLYYISNRLKFKKIQKERHLNFQKNTYKIYKFIYNQVSSGVRLHDCIIGLYDVIDDKQFKRVLINMSAVYSQTSNIDLSLESITDMYPGIDSIMLCSAIKQGVHIGNNMETIERQEKLAFNKYFIYIKNETEKIRFRGFISMTLFAVIIILLLSIPLLYEMKEATSKIFVN